MYTARLLDSPATPLSNQSGVDRESFFLCRENLGCFPAIMTSLTLGLCAHLTTVARELTPRADRELAAAFCAADGLTHY